VKAVSLVTNIVRRSDAPERLLLMVHGLGADEHDLEPLLGYLDPGGRFLAVLPRAPHSVPPGYGWFDFGGPDGLDRTSFTESVGALDDLLDRACADHSLPREEAVVGGFSQGAAVTLALAFRRSGRPRPFAVLTMSGFLVQAPWLPLVDDGDGEPLPPVLVQHGVHDPLLPATRGRAAARALTALGAPVVHREYPMAHEVSLESMGDARAWLDRVLAGDRPADP
jgi:phospholipase/carboxylesterase